jgi:hypothetical protein
MSDASLHQLEREVEAARGKLADHLSTLRSPATYSAFSSDLKSEAIDVKDALVDKARSSVQSAFDNFVDDLKARAAANPAAVLTIGAGIAWRLFQRPPIATTLVGAGLYSLFRTAPRGPAPRDTESFLAQARERLVEQTGGLADHIRRGATAMGEAVAEKAGEVASDGKASVASLRETATSKATELAENAKDRSSAVYRSASDQLEAATSRAGDMGEEYFRPLQQAVNDQESRDSLLLGAAGVAVVAALGIAWQRRLNAAGETE